MTTPSPALKTHCEKVGRAFHRPPNGPARPARPATMTLLGASATMPDLATMICRQRLVVEGRMTKVITPEVISSYLSELSSVCEMRALMDPVTHQSELYGWAGWIHWETSGAHFYAWDDPILFFSVDIYTCKAFDPQRVMEFTAEYLGATEVIAKSF
jgi:hypothetical protein